MRDLSIILGLLIFLGLHKDLLALCDGEISVLRGGHYTTLHCFSLGVFPVKSSNIAASATTSRKLKTSFFFVPAFLLLSTMAFVVHLVPTLVSGLRIGFSFWVLRFVSYGYILPFKFTLMQSFWTWESKIFDPALEDGSWASIGLGLLLPFGLRCSLKCYLRLYWLLPL